MKYFTNDNAMNELIKAIKAISGATAEKDRWGGLLVGGIKINVELEGRNQDDKIFYRFSDDKKCVASEAGVNNAAVYVIKDLLPQRIITKTLEDFVKLIAHKDLGFMTEDLFVMVRNRNIVVNAKTKEALIALAKRIVEVAGE
jgi:hypothetical protein